MANAVDNSFKQILASISERVEVQSARSKDRTPLWANALAVALLLAIVLGCYGRTLGTYFLADDFGEVAYVSKIVNGDWNAFWSNWTGNYMQIPGMAVYRPWLLVSLLIDCAIWHANSFGYYLTNVVHFGLDVLLLFAVVSQFTRSWDWKRSFGASLFSAALFAANPLHCESASWVVGRVDAACCTYFLAGLLLFLRARERDSKLLIAGSVVCFWLGILTKEMAIGLPVVVSAVALFLPKNEHNSFGPRLVSALKESAPFWLSTVGYFVVRYLALGTLTGGYTGGIGDGQASSAIAKWLDLDSYTRLAYPFAADLFASPGVLGELLTIAYVGLLVLVTLRALRRDVPLNLLAVVGAWTLAAALPIYKLWGLGLNLEGARFCFFLTAPLAVAAPLLLFAPSSNYQRESDRALPLVAAILLTLIAGVDLKVLSATNASWVHAGKEVKSLVLATAQLTNAVPANKKVAVLGIPKTSVGAHMIYNGHTLMTALKPPFLPQACDQRIETFDPIFFGNSEHINAARLESLLQSGEISDAYVWNRTEKRLVPCELREADESARPMALRLDMSSATQIYTDGHAAAETTDGIVSLHNVIQGDGIKFNIAPVSPTNYDFVEFEYRIPVQTAVPAIPFAVKWTGTMQADGSPQQHIAQLTAAPVANGDWQKVRVPVSHYWHWFTTGQISSLTLLVPPLQNIQIRNAALLPSNTLTPRMTFRKLHADNAGAFYPRLGQVMTVSASNLPTATSITVECTKPNYFFDQAADSAAVLYKSKNLNSTVAQFKLSPEICPVNGFCEIRARTLDEHAKPLGEYSEPLIMFVSP